MKHVGDITKLNGAELPIVDIITGGSPCQDLSVAGKREGLAGERSGLFMEQIRLIKEMREHDRATRGTDVDIRLLRPRYMVWENVPGAFSSNKGEDFRCVLEETARIINKDAVIPKPEGGRWTPSGCIMGDGWSIAWRVHDAQFWGVPQRRKRIALVADFGGETAPEILFERKGVSGDIEPSGETGEGITATPEGDTYQTISFQERAGKPGGGKGLLIQHERTGALSTLNNQYVHRGGQVNDAMSPSIEVSKTLNCMDDTMKIVTGKCLNAWDVQSKHIQPEDGKAEALYSGECRYGGGESYVMQKKVYGISSYESNAMKSENPHSGIYEAETTRTLDNNGGNPACNQGGMIVLEGNGQRDSHKGDGYKESDTMYTLNTVEQHAVCVSQDAYDKFTENEKSASLKACGGTYGGVGSVSDTVGTLCAADAKGVGNQYVNDGKCIIQYCRSSDSENQ